MKNLFHQHYRDYLDEEDNVKPDRKEFYKAFLYFADRILPSMNAEVTNFRGERRCDIKISKIFTVTDEAYALLMVENYFERWVDIAKSKKSNAEGEDSQESGIERSSKRKVGAKYTKSANGNIHAGWEEEGIKRFNDIANIIQRQRNDNIRNDKLEDALRDHWKGMKKDTQSRRKPEEETGTIAFTDASVPEI